MTDYKENKHLTPSRGERNEQQGNSEIKTEATVLKAGIVVFPGTNCDKDTFEACREFGWDAEYIWHDNIQLCTKSPSPLFTSPLEGEVCFQCEQKLANIRKQGEGSITQQSVFPPQSEFQPIVANAENINESNNPLNKFDVIFLPGGFSYGDYVRSGALAKFSPVIEYLKEYIEQKRGFVVGICNGFQILCEAGLLPGALTHNEGLKFICADSELFLNEEKIKKERGKSPNWNFNNQTKSASPLETLPSKTIKYRFVRGNVCFQCEQLLASIRKQGEGSRNQQPLLPLTLPIAHAEGRYVADEKTIQELKEKEMIFLTYKENPNGSVENIAGLYDKERRIIGMMPHPERAFFKELGNEDGKIIFDLIEKRCV